MRKTRILFLATEDWYFWGHRRELAGAVRDIGCEVFVATAQGSLAQTIKAENITFCPIRLRRRETSVLAHAVALLDLILIYRRIKPDLVHHVALMPIIFGSLAAIFARIPSAVNAITGLGYAFAADDSKRRLLRRLVEIACSILLHQPNTSTIFQNQDDLQLFVNRGLVSQKNTALILGAGVDTKRFAPSPLPTGKTTLLLTSRMIWDKGIGEFVGAVRLLQQQGCNIRAVLAGIPDPSNPASIPQGQLEAWHKEGVVTWLGHQTDVPQLLAQCHIFCLPTFYREGVPMSLIEAASCGRPIVTTDTPGCRDIVQDGINGLLVPVKDPLKLAAAIKKLIESPNLAFQMGQAGRQLVLSKFSKEIVISETFKVYQSLLGVQWWQRPS